MPTLLLDVNYLAHKARCAYPNLSHNGQDTNVVFGIMRDLVHLQKKFGEGTVAWFFDGANLKRKQVYSGYKMKREKVVWDKQTLGDLKSMRKQMSLMYNEWLPEIGYKNIRAVEGYEADDLIASATMEMTRYTFAPGKCPYYVIVASDKDYYQLLTPRVEVWHPQQNKLVTMESFTSEWGIAPSQWATVKAIAGCNSDEVPGPEGVGDKTAASWIQQHSDNDEYKYKTVSDFIEGKIKKRHKTYQAIVDWIDNEKGFKRNLKLVRLPYHGTPKIKIKEDNLTKIDRGLRRLANKLGMESLGSRDRLLGRVE